MGQTKREIQSIGSSRDLTKILCIAHLTPDDDGISHDQSGQPPINPCRVSLPSLVRTLLYQCSNEPAGTSPTNPQSSFAREPEMYKAYNSFGLSMMSNNWAVSQRTTNRVSTPLLHCDLAGESARKEREHSSDSVRGHKRLAGFWELGDR